MKFLYEFRTPDNAKHNGVICASDREVAYALLKKQGVKPSRLIEAPGFLNKLFGKGKRWLAICVLGGMVVAAACVIQSNSRTIEQSQNLFDSPLRRQPLGDAAIIDHGLRTGWVDVFELEGERFLASFAVPGVPAGQRNTTENEIRKALDAPARPVASDGIEARQIRAMVEGMKDELREFLSDGGTVAEYGRELVRRQEQEIAYYKQVKNELEEAVKAKVEKSKLDELWESQNAKLRKMGIRLVPMPSEQ